MTKPKQNAAGKAKGKPSPDFDTAIAALNPEDKPRHQNLTYTELLAGVICGCIASGHSLRKICAVEGMPTKTTVMRWLFEPSDFQVSFRDQYARARKAQAELHADEITDIADDSSNDLIYTDSGKLACNTEFVARSRLRVDARKWIAAKLLPKVYGDIKPQGEGEETPPPLTSVEYVSEDAG